MKKLLTVFFCLFVFASLASAQCGINNPKFGDSKEKAIPFFTQELGVPNQVSKDSIMWVQNTATGVMTTVAMFYKDKFKGIHILAAMDATKDNALVAIDLFKKMEELAKEEGFVFVKNGKDKSGTIDMMYSEYECKDDRRIKNIVTLGKDMSKLVFSVDTLTYFDGEFK
jgi:hypothetical protein